MSPDGRSASLDLDHLDRQTCGDSELARDLLTLFDGQCARLLPAILDRGEGRGRPEAAHTLLGAARAVGAVRVAAIAEQIEALGPAAAPDGALLAGMDRAIGEVRAAIARHLSGAAGPHA